MSNRSPIFLLPVAVWGLCAGAGAAQTQQPVALTIGQPHGAEISQESVAFGDTGFGWYDCYTLETQAGAQIEIATNTGRLMIMIGDTRDCGAIALGDYDLLENPGQTGSDRPPIARFISGGGVYTVVIVYLTGQDMFSYPYTLTAREVPEARIRETLPPGLPPLPSTPAGTASTVPPSEQAADYAPGVAFRDCDTCPEMVVIPAGTFMMGSPDTEEGHNANEGPLHQVTIGRPFAMGKTEVTFDEYDACVADGGCEAVDDSGWGRGRRPVINVSWEDAQRYVAWLSAKTGAQYFIPSEAEWEYAARAGTTTPWNTGTAIITADANFLDQFGRTVVVGSYPPNAFGLHDMHGNVGEWTQDCMDTGYLGAPADGSAATSGDCATRRVFRDGGFDLDAARQRSAARSFFPQAFRTVGIGIRVARAL